MTQVSAPPQSLPGTAPAQAAAPVAADPAAGAEGMADFAAVLQAQVARPAKDALGAEILAALPATAGPVLAAGEAKPGEAPTTTPDLSALLPVLAGLLPQGRPAEEATAPAAGAVLPARLSMPVAPAAFAAPAASTESTAFATPRATAANAAAPDAGVAPAAETASSPTLPTRDIQDLTTADPTAVPAAAAAPTSNEMPTPAQAVDFANPSTTPFTAAPTGQAAPASAAPAVVHVGTAVGQRGWDAEVGQKIVLLANHQESRAELTLTPPQLGRVEVSITVNGDQTSAAFVSASPAAREALEQAIPRTTSPSWAGSTRPSPSSAPSSKPRNNARSTDKRNGWTNATG